MRFSRVLAGIVFVAAATAAGLSAQQAPQGVPPAGAPGQGGAGRGGGRGPQGPPLTLSSPAFVDLALLPAKYGCAATPNNVSFPLAWANAPAATQSFAVVVTDADLRQARGHVAPSHWVLWNIPATVMSLPEAVPAIPELPDGSRQTITAGRNGAPGTGYRAMCPPAPTTHHYAIELYALDIKLDTLATGAQVTDLYAAIDGHVIGHQIMVVPFHQ